MFGAFCQRIPWAAQAPPRPLPARPTLSRQCPLHQPKPSFPLRASAPPMPPSLANVPFLPISTQPLPTLCADIFPSQVPRPSPSSFKSQESLFHLIPIIPYINQAPSPCYQPITHFLLPKCCSSVYIPLEPAPLPPPVRPRSPHYAAGSST